MKRVNKGRSRRPRVGAPAVVGLLVTAAAAIALGASAAPAPALGAASGQRAAPAQRACTPADIAIAVGGTGAYQGHATQELVLSNRAGDACFLPGAPSAALLFDDGSQEAASSGQFATSRVDLSPGGSALVLVGAPGTCAGADPSRSRVARRMALGIPGNGSIPVQGVNLDVQCGPSSVLLMEVATGA